MARAQRPIFNLCKFNAEEVVKSNKFAYARAKQYKDRLHALGNTQVSGDEAPPATMVPDDGFPEGALRTTLPNPMPRTTTSDSLGWWFVSFPFLVLA